MPGVHTYLQTIQLNLIIYTNPWPRIMNSAGKEEVSNGPAHGPPLQARVAAANGTVLQLANMLVYEMMILAHMEMNRAHKAK